MKEVLAIVLLFCLSLGIGCLFGLFTEMGLKELKWSAPKQKLVWMFLACVLAVTLFFVVVGDMRLFGIFDTAYSFVILMGFLFGQAYFADKLFGEKQK